MSRLTPQTVRFWAWVDSSVTLVLAVPPLAQRFIELLYHVNGWLGGPATPPAFDAIHWFFVSLSGILVTVWVIARLAQPVAVLGLIDGWGRAVVSFFIVYYVIFRGAPVVLMLFVATEGAGAVNQLWRGYCSK